MHTSITNPKGKKTGGGRNSRKEFRPKNSHHGVCGRRKEEKTRKGGKECTHSTLNGQGHGIYRKRPVSEKSRRGKTPREANFNPKNSQRGQRARAGFLSEKHGTTGSHIRHAEVGATKNPGRRLEFTSDGANHEEEKTALHAWRHRRVRSE